METKMLTFWLGLVILLLSLIMLISGLLKTLVIIHYRHQRQQQCHWLLSEPNETKSQPCKKGEDEEKLEILTQLRQEGLLTEQAFQREVKRLKFDKYWY
jgi:hypothetical protein